MVNILIITHGPLAHALVETSKIIVGNQTKITTLGLFVGDSPEKFAENVETKIDQLSKDHDLLIFTDLYGGTPSNSTLIKLNKLNFPKSIACYTGVNLPLLLESIPLCNTSDNVQEVEQHLDSILEYTMINIGKKFNHK